MEQKPLKVILNSATVFQRQSKYVYMCICMIAYMYGGQRSPSGSSSLFSGTGSLIGLKVDNQMMLASQQAILLGSTHLCLPKATISSVDHHAWCYVGSGELKSSCLQALQRWSHLPDPRNTLYGNMHSHRESQVHIPYKESITGVVAHTSNLGCRSPRQKGSTNSRSSLAAREAQVLKQN